MAGDTPPRFRTIVVVGSGRMAPGIAVWWAAEGVDVRITGRTPSRVEAATARARELQAVGGTISSRPFEASTFADCELVIETVVEDFETKFDVLRKVANWSSPDTVIVTNTSGLSVADLSQAVNGHGFLGLHYLYPAHMTPIVEVIPSPTATENDVAGICAVARERGKAPLVIRKEVPGFLWNRLQFALLRECLNLLDEGVADVATIDLAVSAGLAPRWVALGPLGTADLGGLDTFARVATLLFPDLATSDAVSPQLLERAQAGETFYAWSDEALEQIDSLRIAMVHVQREVAKERPPLPLTAISASPMQPQAMPAENGTK